MGMNVPVTPAPPAGYVAPLRPRAWSAAALARWSLIGAATATLVAFVARVWALGDASLWYDEGYSVIAAARSLPGLFSTIVPADNNPPLHYLFLALAIRLFGMGEFAVRFVSLIPGVLMVPLAYVTAAEVLHGHPGRRTASAVAGVSAAALVSLSPYLIFYAQEARMYSQLALFALLALWTLLWATRPGAHTPRDPWPWLAHGAAIALMLYSHYAGVLLLPALAAYALLVGGRAFGRWLLAAVFGLLLWLPWLPSALAQVRRFGTVPEYFPAQLQFGDVLGQIVTRFLGVASMPLAFSLAGALLVAALLAVVSLWRTDAALARRITLLVLAAALPMLLTAGLATVVPKFVPRYAIVATPALLVTAPVVLVALLWNRHPAGRVVYGGLVALALLASLGGAWQAARTPFLGKDDVRGVARYITERAKPEQAVLHVRNTPEAFDYYYRGAAPRYAMDVADSRSGRGQTESDTGGPAEPRLAAPVAERVYGPDGHGDYRTDAAQSESAAHPRQLCWLPPDALRAERLDAHRPKRRACPAHRRDLRGPVDAHGRRPLARSLRYCGLDADLDGRPPPRPRLLSDGATHRCGRPNTVDPQPGHRHALPVGDRLPGGATPARPDATTSACRSRPRRL
ncbi:MAG: glycosyltransferase family 39 protein [Anaerolineae bacterium]|nr:glycosyltransferase family 39 protein [Anaerolineae bacterium]